MDKSYIGIDAGGSFTKGGLVCSGKIVHKAYAPTKPGSLDSIFAVIDEIIKNSGNTEICGIGIGIAGMVINKRFLLGAANLNLSNTDVAGIVEEKYKVPVKIGNDVSCFALAEAATRKIQNLVYLALGTGLNIGIISNGKLFSGADGASIEYGHTCFMPNDAIAPVCSCGLHGCLETFVSGKALMASGKNLGIVASKPEEVFAASEEIAGEFIANLCIALVNIVNTYRPQKIFIGGGLAAMVEPYINKLNNYLKQKSYGYKNAPEVTVEMSALSIDGAILGAVSLLM